MKIDIAELKRRIEERIECNRSTGGMKLHESDLEGEYERGYEDAMFYVLDILEGGMEC